MSADSPSERLVPLDDVDPSPQARRQYLLNCGWTEEGPKFRWKGQGKRTLSEAVREQRQREIEQLASALPTTRDELLVRRCARSKVREVVTAAAANPIITPDLLQELVDAGYLEAVASSPVITDRLARAVITGVQRKDNFWHRSVDEALIRNPHASLEIKRELLEPWLNREVFRSIRWQGTPVMAAAECADPALVRFICRAAIERFNVTPVYELDDRRDCEAVLLAIAENPQAPPDQFEALATLEYGNLDSALVNNPAIPLGLYRRLAPLVAQKNVGDLSLRVIAVAPDGRRLWIDEYSSRADRFEREPEGAYIRLAEMDDGDILASGRDFDDRGQKSLGRLLWIPVHWPRSSKPLYYRGYGHGLTDYESSRFLRESGADVLVAWPEIRKTYIQGRPELPVWIAQRQFQEAVESAERRRRELLREALDHGVPPLRLARILGVRVAELRSELEMAQKERAELDELRANRPWQFPSDKAGVTPSKLSVALNDVFGEARVELEFASSTEEPEGNQ
jgi:hypothetical protein